MAIMYITEYSSIAGDKDGHIVQAGKHDGYETTQKISFTTSTQSAAFQDDTHFIRVSCDTAAFLEFGSNPIAVTADDTPVQANTPEFFGVVGGQKIAAVT